MLWSSNIRCLDTIMLPSWAPHSLLFPCKEGAWRANYLCLLYLFGITRISESFEEYFIWTISGASETGKAMNIDWLVMLVDDGCEHSQFKRGILYATGKMDRQYFHHLKNWFWNNPDIEIVFDTKVFEFHFPDRFQSVACEASN